MIHLVQPRNLGLLDQRRLSFRSTLNHQPVGLQAGLLLDGDLGATALVDIVKMTLESGNLGRLRLIKMITKDPKNEYLILQDRNLHPGCVQQITEIPLF